MLVELAWPEYAANWDTAIEDAALPIGARGLALAALDPRNVTLEPEYYGDCDTAKFARVKPLLWLWYSFDRLPIGGQNVWTSACDSAACSRRTSSSGAASASRRSSTWSFSFEGYNIECGDDVVVHRHVLLDDRGGILIGNKVSISDYANIYSHTHSIVDQADVTDAMTVLEDGVRITYHATVLAGIRVGTQGMVGAVAVATKDVRPYHVNVGIPAKSVRVKPNAPPGAHARLRAVEKEP